MEWPLDRTQTCLICIIKMLRHISTQEPAWEHLIAMYGCIPVAAKFLRFFIFKLGTALQHICCVRLGGHTIKQHHNLMTCYPPFRNACRMLNRSTPFRIVVNLSIVGHLILCNLNNVSLILRPGYLLCLPMPYNTTLRWRYVPSTKLSARRWGRYTCGRNQTCPKCLSTVFFLKFKQFRLCKI